MRCRCASKPPDEAMTHTVQTHFQEDVSGDTQGPFNCGALIAEGVRVLSR